MLQFTSKGWKGQIKAQVARLALTKSNEQDFLDTILWDLFGLLTNTGTAPYIDPDHWKGWLWKVTGGRLLIDGEFFLLVTSKDDHLYAIRDGSIVLTTEESFTLVQHSLPLRRFLNNLLISQKAMSPFVVDDTTWTIVGPQLPKGVAIDLIPYTVKHRYDRNIILLPFGKPWIEWAYIRGLHGRKMCPYCEAVLVAVEFDQWQICGVKDECRRTAYGEIVIERKL